MIKYARIRARVSCTLGSGLQRIVWTVRGGRKGTGKVLARFAAYETIENDIYIERGMRYLEQEATNKGYTLIN